MTSVSELMSRNPVCLDEGAPVLEAARAMRDRHIGNVVVTRRGRVFGVLTDRDIVVRCLAEDKDMRQCTCGEIASSTDVVTISGDRSARRRRQVDASAVGPPPRRGGGPKAGGNNLARRPRQGAGPLAGSRRGQRRPAQ